MVTTIVVIPELEAREKALIKSEEKREEARKLLQDGRVLAGIKIYNEDFEAERAEVSAIQAKKVANMKADTDRVLKIIQSWLNSPPTAPQQPRTASDSPRHQERRGVDKVYSVWYHHLRGDIYGRMDNNCGSCEDP